MLCRFRDTVVPMYIFGPISIVVYSNVSNTLQRNAIIEMPETKTKASCGHCFPTDLPPQRRQIFYENNQFPGFFLKSFVMRKNPNEIYFSIQQVEE